MVKTRVYTINHILLTFGAITTQKKGYLGLVVLIFSTELGEWIPDSSFQVDPDLVISIFDSVHQLLGVLESESAGRPQTTGSKKTKSK